MNARKIVALGAAGAVALAVLAAGAAHASIAPSPADTVVGNLHGATYWFPQSYGDCVEGAADVVIGEVKGARLKEATIVAEASKLLGYDVKNGTWFTDLPTILGHYGVNSHVGSHNIATVEVALAAGHKVIAQVDAQRIWNALPPVVAVFGLLPDTSTANYGDHALAVDSIDETAGTVTLTDTGDYLPVGAAETVPLSVFKSSWSTSGYMVDITG